MSHPLIQKFLEKLRLDDLNPDQRLIALAHAVSAIPWGEGRTIEEVLGTKHVGTCTGKHLVLQACFDALGIAWRPVVCTFRWSEQGMALPQDCRNILASSEWEHGHNFVQIKNRDGQWIDLDITWDPPLAVKGFKSLPATWNGSAGFIGVHNLVQRWNGVSMYEKKKELIEGLSPEMKTKREQFLHTFIVWIASLRKQGSFS